MAPRRPSSPRPETPVLSLEQLHLRITRLQDCIRALGEFDPQKVQKRYGIPEVMELEASIKGALAAAFGDGTPAYNRYRGLLHSTMDLTLYVPAMHSAGAHKSTTTRETLTRRVNISPTVNNGRLVFYWRRYALLNMKSPIDS